MCSVCSALRYSLRPEAEASEGCYAAVVQPNEHLATDRC